MGGCCLSRSEYFRLQESSIGLSHIVDDIDIRTPGWDDESSPKHRRVFTYNKRLTYNVMDERFLREPYYVRSGNFGCKDPEPFHRRPDDFSSRTL